MDLPNSLINALENAEAHRLHTGRPLTILSYAQSLDGSLTVTRGVHTDVSGPEAFKLSHQMRAAFDAILVGVGTVLSDNPRLTTRLVEGPDPQRVLIDGRLRSPVDAALLQPPAPAWVMTTTHASEERRMLLRNNGVECTVFSPDSNGKVPLSQVLAEVATRGINSLMVEGGGEIITGFLQGGLADLVLLTISPRFFGGYPAVAAKLNTVAALKNTEISQVGKDFILFGEIEK